MCRVTAIWLAWVVMASSAPMARGEEPYRVIYPKQDQKVGAALLEPLKAPAFTGGLRDYFGEIAKAHRINILIDEQALTDAGVDIDDDIDFDPAGIDPRTADLRGIDLERGIRLDATLRLLLDPYEMTYVVEDGVLKVTTNEHAAGKVMLRAYDVSALLDADMTTEELAAGVTRLATSVQYGRPNNIAAASMAVELPLEIVPYKKSLVVTGDLKGHRRVERALGMMGQVVAE